MRVLQHAARLMADTFGRESAVVRSVRPFYGYALARFAGNDGIPWTINGADFRIDPRQRHRMGHVYDAAVAEYLSSKIKPGAICFDVGANVGVYALQLGRWTGPGGRVFAFEPNPVSARALADHVSMNGLDGCVETIETAVADTIGVSTFHMADADGMSRLGVANPEIASQTRAVNVPTTTLDAFCLHRNVLPDWLVIDVEGFEFSVLAGARSVIEERGVDLEIIVEMHPNAWHVAGWSRQRAEELLGELQLTATSLTGDADPLATYGHVLLCASRI